MSVSKEKTEGRRHCEDEGGDWSDAAKEQVEPPKPGRGQEGFSPRTFRGSMALLTPWFQIFGLQNWGENKCLLF